MYVQENIGRYQTIPRNNKELAMPKKFTKQNTDQPNNEPMHPDTVTSVTSAASSPFQSVTDYLQSLVDQKRYPGASVLIQRGNREVYFAAVGQRDLATLSPIQRDTVFRIYSMTKPITAVAISILMEDRKLKLSDPVSKFVPEFEQLQVYAGQSGDSMLTKPAGPISIEDLLTHTAGLSYSFQENTPVAALYAKTALADDDWRFDPAYAGGNALARTLASLPLVAQPGSRWHYSMALDLAALVVQKAAGLPFDVFLKQRIFAPLEMTDTDFWVPPEKADRLASLYTPAVNGGFELVDAAASSSLLAPVPGLSGGAGLLSTIDDYSRFAQMLVSGGSAGNQRLLSRAAVDAIMTNQLRRDQLMELPATASFGLGSVGEGLGFGYGGAVVMDIGPDGVGSVGEYTWGGAASTIFWVDPVEHIVVIFMTQVIPPGGEPIRDRLRELIYSALA
jgi:CubicO group peptidase (beta-lactamase class C family)